MRRIATTISAAGAAAAAVALALAGCGHHSDAVRVPAQPISTSPSADAVPTASPTVVGPSSSAPTTTPPATGSATPPIEVVPVQPTPTTPSPSPAPLFSLADADRLLAAHQYSDRWHLWLPGHGLHAIQAMDENSADGAQCVFFFTDAGYVASSAGSVGLKVASLIGPTVVVRYPTWKPGAPVSQPSGTMTIAYTLHDDRMTADRPRPSGPMYFAGPDLSR